MSTQELSAPSRSTDLCLRLARANAVLIRRFDSGLGNHHGISYGDFQLLNHLGALPAAACAVSTWPNGWA